MIIRSGGADRILNLRIFCGLVQELRTKLDITKEGVGPDKAMQIVNFGLKEASRRQKVKNDAVRQHRIEKIVLQEFNMLNMSRVQSALQQAEL